MAAVLETKPCPYCGHDFKDLAKASEMSVRFRKRPVTIEAMRFTGHNATFIEAWFIGHNSLRFFGTRDGRTIIRIETLEGVMEAQAGDWIIRGIKGEFYPCKNEIFSETYDPEEYIGLQIDN